MEKIEGKFKYKGVNFEVLKRGEKALMLKADAEFYTCRSIEVWQIRVAKESIINGNIIPIHERKPSNEDYPYTAHQFMENHYMLGYNEMIEKANKRFNEYETGLRPKTLTEFD